MIDDPEAAARSAAGTSILCTLRLGVTRLLELVESSKRPSPIPRVQPNVPVATNPLSAEFLMHTIAHIMPRDAAIVEEAPSHENAMHDYLPIRTSNAFYTMASGGLGYGLPAAIGVALADPKRRVICLLGDGASMYSVQGLWTAVQHHLPITFIVLNNHGYAALKDFGRLFNMDDFPGTDLPGINFEAIAKGFGCAALHVEHAEDLADALTRSFASEGPILLDVLVDPAITPLY
jgi:benzoylformate decarboxylase